MTGSQHLSCLWVSLVYVCVVCVFVDSDALKQRHRYTVVYYFVLISFAGCSSLIGGLVDDCAPSALVITHCMTPPQAYWIRYAQTEVIEVWFFHSPVAGGVWLGRLRL